MLNMFLAMIETQEEKNKFEWIYDSYQQTMYYVANSVLHNNADAEDAVQQSFIRIIENLDKFNPSEQEQTKGLVVILVKRIAIDIYRKKQRHVNLSLNEDNGIENSTSAAVYQPETDDRLEKALLMLPTNYAEVIKLKYSHEYTDKEISRMLSITEGNVRQRLLRAKTKLKDILEEMESCE